MKKKADGAVFHHASDRILCAPLFSVFCAAGTAVLLFVSSIGLRSQADYRVPDGQNGVQTDRYGNCTVLYRLVFCTGPYDDSRKEKPHMCGKIQCAAYA